MFPPLSAQRCTNEKSTQVHWPRVTIINHYYLEEIGFDPQNRRATCPDPRIREASGLRIHAANWWAGAGGVIPWAAQQCFPVKCTTMHNPKTAATCRSPAKLKQRHPLIKNWLLPKITGPVTRQERVKSLQTGAYRRSSAFIGGHFHFLG